MTDVPTWGPWTEGLTTTERAARCRALAALIAVFAGPAGAETVHLLRAGETDDIALADAGRELRRLPTACMRRAVGTYGALHGRPGS